jgi:hypothetical protein
MGGLCRRRLATQQELVFCCCAIGVGMQTGMDANDVFAYAGDSCGTFLWRVFGLAGTSFNQASAA